MVRDHRNLPIVKLDSHQRRHERLQNRQYGVIALMSSVANDLFVHTERVAICWGDFSPALKFTFIFVMYTSAYIYSLVIIRYWSLNKIVQSLYTVHIPIHDNVTWTNLKWFFFEIAIQTSDGYTTNNFSYMRRRDRRRCFWMHPICHKRISIV